MKRIYFLCLLLLLIRLGWFFYSLPRYKPGQLIRLESQIDSQPVTVMGKQRFWIDGHYVSVANDPELHFGDKVVVEGRIGQGGKLDQAEAKLVSKYELNPWEKVAFGLRSKFIETYHTVFLDKQANLLSGVVLGSVGLDRQFKSKLADVGLTHVVAASGMNLTLFSGFVVLGLKRLRLKKIQIAILSMLFILFYSTVTGFEPPIVRAGIMAALTYLATLTGRQNSGLWGLSLAAYLMLWVSPNLLTNASFLLSFGSMTGQVFLSGVSSNLPESKTLLAEIKGTITGNFWQSFLAIVFTLPLVLIFFAKFSLVSLITNTLVLWTIEPLMVFGGLIGLSGLISPDLAQVFALPTEPLLRFFLWVVDVFSGKDYFLWHFQINGPLFALGYYLVLGGLVWWWQREKITI